MSHSVYYSTKTYGHEQGLSAAFRQWKAKSHCRFWHGYPLSFTFTFKCTSLDEHNWCMDFGSLKPIKQWLTDTFDHKLLVARDDPHREKILALQDLGLCEVVEVDATGCEAFANMAYWQVANWLIHEGHFPRVTIYRVEVREHGGNSAIFEF